MLHVNYVAWGRGLAGELARMAQKHSNRVHNGTARARDGCWSLRLSSTEKTRKKRTGSLRFTVRKTRRGVCNTPATSKKCSLQKRGGRATTDPHKNVIVGKDHQAGEGTVSARHSKFNIFHWQHSQIEVP